MPIEIYLIKILKQLEEQQVPVSNRQPPVKPAHTITSEYSGYVPYESKIRPNVIYDNSHEEHIAEVSVKDYSTSEQPFTYDEHYSLPVPDLPKSYPPDSPDLNQIKYQQQQQQQQQKSERDKQQQREKQQREQEQRERQQYEQQREREREREKREREQQQQQQYELEMEKKNAEARERELKERERQELERKRVPHKASEQPAIQAALAALTSITALGAEPIQTAHAKPYELEEPAEKIQKEYQKPLEQSQLQAALAAATAITALGSEPTYSTQVESSKPSSVFLDRITTKPAVSEPYISASITAVGEQPIKADTVLLDKYKPKPNEPATFNKITVVSEEPTRIEQVFLDKYKQKPAGDESSPLTTITAVGNEPITSVVINAEQPETTSNENVSITVVGNEPIKSTFHQQRWPDMQTINIASDKSEPKKQPLIHHKYPAVIDETNVYTTKTITQSVSQIHEIREEIIEHRDPKSGETSQQVLETEIVSSSTYVPADESVDKDQNQRIHQLPIQREEEDDNLSEASSQDLARQQYAGIYHFI